MLIYVFHHFVNRLESLSSRCSITNTEVFNHVDSEEEVKEEFSAASSNCPVPIVHIQTDILETEVLNFLDEDTDVDTLLTTLPV